MDKNVDTQWMSPRQVLLLAPAGSEISGQVSQILRLPRYVTVACDDAETASRLLGEHKIEVLLLEPEAGKTRSPAILARLREADPSAQLVVLAPWAALPATVVALQGRTESAPAVLGFPFSAPELVQAVENARELRYLRRADERGRRAEARISAVVRSAPHAIVSLDAPGVIHDWNPAAETIFGWSAAEAVGRPFWDLAVASPSQALRAEVSPARNVRAEIAGRRRDGSEFPARLSLAAVAAAERPMFCAIIEDVTEARRLELELRHAQKLEAVGRLASGLAHEINTPCQFVGANAHFLGETLMAMADVLGAYQALRVRAVAGAADGDDATLAAAVAEVEAVEEAADLPYLRERAPGALAGIEEGVRRIARIVSAMKGFAQPDVRDKMPVDLNVALADTLTVLENETRAVAEVVTDFGAIPPVSGYGGDLNQAFLQIVLNAVHAVADRQAGSEARGRITVRTRPEGEMVLVEISDTGVGIPEPIRHRIFDQFFTTKEVGRGTGQGLAVARSVVAERHGGALTFQSEVGVGTTFQIRLPVLT